MKIHPNLTLIQGRFQTQRPVRNLEGASAGFTVKRIQDSAKNEEVVSLENRRALKEMPQNFHEADRLLKSLTTQVTGFTKDELKNLHKLEGLVQIISG